MKRADAEHLLGGYATGILSEAERKLLFEAALQDQALFDALADEEALRELLEDPAARTQLLAALTRVPKVVPFWRRPMVLGAAASLLVAVGGTLLVQRSEQAAYRFQEPKAPAAAEPRKENTPTSTAEAPKAEPPTTVHQDKLDGAAAPLRLAPQHQPAPLPSDTSGAGGRQPSAESMADMAPGVAAKVAPVAQAKAKAMRPDAKDQEAKPAELNIGGPPTAPPAQPAPAPAASFAGAPAAETRAKKEARQDAGDAAHGVNLGGVAGGSTLGQSISMERIEAIPTWKVDSLSEGRLRLRVLWEAHGHLYLLRRRASGSSVIAPLSTKSTTGGQIESVFITPCSEGEALDLYLLPQAAPHPEALPPDGHIEGFRARVWPEPKKTP